MKKKIIFSLLIPLIATVSLAQQRLTIESPLKFHAAVSSAQVPLDRQGNKTAKVIVELPIEQAVIEGSWILGEPVFKGGQYEIFVVTKGSRKQSIKVRHDQFSSIDIPLEVDGEDLLPEKAYRVKLAVKGEKLGVNKKLGFLTIISEPSDADVYINGERIGKTPYDWKSEIGRTVKYTVKKKLYHDAEGEVKVKNSKQETKVLLKSAFGSINIKSTPDNATVFIDGKECGKTPFKLDTIESGQHTIRIEKTLYGQQEKVLTVDDGKQTSEIFLLKERFGTLNVNSLDGAEIILDGKKVANSKYSVKLAPGFYQLEATLSSHKTVNRQVEITVGESQSIDLMPIPQYGNLSVRANIRGANIIIDGKDYGVTPNVINNLLAGTYKLKVVSGQKEYSQSVTITENKTTDVDCTLDFLSGSLTLDGYSGAFTVDGVNANTNKPLDLRPGKHNIRIKGSGQRKSYHQTVDIKGGESYTLKVEQKWKYFYMDKSIMFGYHGSLAAPYGLAVGGIWNRVGFFVDGGVNPESYKDGQDNIHSIDYYNPEDWYDVNPDDLDKRGTLRFCGHANLVLCIFPWLNIYGGAGYGQYASIYKLKANDKKTGPFYATYDVKGFEAQGGLMLKFCKNFYISGGYTHNFSKNQFGENYKELHCGLGFIIDCEK